MAQAAESPVESPLGTTSDTQSAAVRLPVSITPEAPSDDTLLYETETWFVRRGLPYFIEDYKATDNVFTKALPILIVYFIGNLMVVLSLHLTPIERATGAALGTALLVVAYLVRNLLTGQRMLSMPKRVGWFELIAFTAIPPIVDYVVRRKPIDTAVDLVVNVGVILAIYVLTSALLPLGRWAVLRTFQELGETFDLAARALPLLFLFNSFLFISQDVWEFAGDMSPHRLWAVVSLFAVFTILFLLYRLPDEVAKVAAHDDRMSIATACKDTPMDGVYDRIRLHEGALPLNRAQRGNILMILFVGQILQILLLAILVWIFFLGFGAVTLTPERINDWTGRTADIVQIMGHPLSYDGFAIDYRLLYVSIFLAAVSGFFFAVSSLTDEAYKEQFFARMNRELETAIQVRRVYLALYEGRHAHDDDLGLTETHLWERLPGFHRGNPDDSSSTLVETTAEDPNEPSGRSPSKPPANLTVPGQAHEHRRWFDTGDGSEPPAVASVDDADEV